MSRRRLDRLDRYDFGQALRYPPGQRGPSVFVIGRHAADCGHERSAGMRGDGAFAGQIT